MQSDLQELKNLGNTSINWLHAIGVNNSKELRELGAVEAYIRIKQRGIRVSKVLLYALQGALDNTHWNDLDGSVKLKLVDQAKERSTADIA